MFRAALSTALVALASLQQTYAQAAWHMDTLNMLAMSRLDPVVSPNQVAGHMHAIVGGSAFGASYNYPDQIASSCTTASLTVDKSNYWMPQLYWVNDDGSFVPLDNKPRFYYFLGRNSNAEPVSPFPEGLRMLTGDPNSKSPNPKSSFTCHINPDLSTGSIIQDNFNFNRDCPYGIRIEITFRSCWDGINLYKSDGSHVVDPSNSQSDRVGGCPFDHPVRIPLIMFEMTFRPSAWAPGVPTAGHLAWANGDMTGYGVHADFVNGWDTKVLAAALNDTQCAPATQQAMSIQNCNVFSPYYQANPQCSPSKGQMNEPGSSNTPLVPIPALAGCNPTWTSGSKPGCSSPRPAPDVTAWKGTDGPYQATGSAVKTFSLPTTGGVQQIACIKDNGGSVVTNGYTYYDNSVTGASCMNTCLKAGYRYAATGFANGRWDCRCGDGILNTASTYPGMCTTPCPGDASQMCGSTDVHSVYYATNGTTANYTMGQTTQGYGGCYSPKGTNSLSTRITYQYTDNNLTPDACLQVCANMNATWAGTTAGRTCMCGSDMTLGTGVYVADSYCAQPCGGNANVTCGATSYYSLYLMSKTGVVAATNPNQPPGRKGCFQDNSGASLTGYSWTNNGMTVDQCNYGCAELGYSLSGLIFGNRCRCGNTWTGGQIYPDSNCNSPCLGNSSETCGGNYKTELYDTAPALALVQADIAARPSGWIGCVANSPGTALANYNAYDGQLTVERCIATCNTYGYAFAGMANGAYCRCGNTDPRTVVQQVPSPQFCTASCPGNSSETCGNAGAYTDSYNVTAYVQASQSLSASKTPGYVGCYSGTSGLSAYSFTQSDMSVDVCTMGCKEMGYTLSGVSSGTCYCDNTWSTGGVLADYRCNSPCPGNANQTCGAYAVSSVWNSSVGVSTPAASQAGYVGCFTDSSSSRTLGSYTYTSPAMTNALCKASCANQGYALAGTESGNQCFCANTIGSGASQIASTQCTSACGGNSGLVCGGSWKMSLFNSTASGVSPSASASANSTSPSGAVKLKSKGCYTDTSTLDQGAYTSAYMTVDQCVSYCKSMSYAFAGLTNGNACRCGNTSPSNLAGPLCTTPCVSNAQQTCGGSGYTEVWPTTQTGLIDTFSASAADSTGYMGCWQDASARTLNGSSFSSSTLTPISCRANCYALGLTFSGTQASSQCYCGATIKPGRIRYADSSCSALCSGDKTQNCGGSWALSVRIRPANAGVTSSTAAPSATLGSGANSTASVNGTKTGSIASASSSVPTSASIEGYNGCYGVGTLVSGATAKYTGLGTMTTGWCRRFCRASGFSVAGLQGGNSCYCGSASQVDKKVSDVACTATCAGDSTSICGDTYLTSLYDTVGAGAVGLAGMPKNWVGCFADQSARTLPGWTFTSSAMTSENCRLSCSAKGYSTYGTESGNQCYCGPSLPTNMVADNACNAKCAGNSTELCGGSWRLSVYNAAFSTGSNDPIVSSALPSASASASSSKAASASASSSKASSASAVSSSKAASVVPSSTSRAASVVLSSTSKAASVVPSSTSKAASVAPSSTSKAASVSPSSSKAASSAVASPSKAASSAVASPSKAASSAVASPSKAASSAVLPSPSKAATSASASPSKRASESPSSSATASSASSTIGGGGLIASPSPKPSSAAAASSSSQVSSAAAATSAPSSASKAPVSSAAPSSAVVSTTTSAIAPSATNHLGCYTQGTPAILDKSVITCDTLTPGMCKLWCNANNYAYAGMTNGTTCGCSSDITALTPVAASQCDKTCFSDNTVTCGGTAGTTYNVWKSSGLIARRNHRKRLRMISGHGSAARRQEAPMHFNSEQEILYYLKRNQPAQ